MIKKKLISEALQQFTGYNVGKWGNIEELVGSMGLTEEEWDYIKENEESGHLDDEDIKKIDGGFKDDN